MEQLVNIAYMPIPSVGIKQLRNWLSMHTCWQSPVEAAVLPAEQVAARTDSRLLFQSSSSSKLAEERVSCGLHHCMTDHGCCLQSGGPLARLTGGHRKSVSMTETGLDSEGKPLPAQRKRHRRKKKVQKQSAALQRKLSFVHVRLNRVILRVTFLVSPCLPINPFRTEMLLSAEGCPSA